ncbi:hypothetical protein F383_14043 [Gossypium arboreum]|uniref:Uncharacterized protein n=1 Tax=Gossypium arboreum TaxID=29729 RepID=A0A0B0NB75_GOSAR|nr:hypothetical protein F383_14043 [Gossypium arboreum]
MESNHLLKYYCKCLVYNAFVVIAMISVIQGLLALMGPKVRWWGFVVTVRH